MPTNPNNLTSLRGGLLFAAPHLADSPFYKSVILITEHDPKEGAEGYIINQPTEQKVHTLSVDKNIPPELYQVDVFFGGPVDTEHLSFGAFALREDKLFYRMAINAQEATDHMQEHGTLVRAFVGKTVWQPGQLERELEDFTWFFAPISEDFMSFTHDSTLWKNLLNILSPMHSLLARAPRHPSLN